MKQVRAMIAAAVAVAILLSGCSMGPNRPVNAGEATPPVQTAKPLLTPTPTVADPTPSPTSIEPTPTPSAQPPAGYLFPMNAAALFGPTKVPDGFAGPVYLSGDGRTFLYGTSEKGIFKAQWTGAEYSIQPEAENITSGAPAAAFVDEQGDTLFCQGTRAYLAGGTGPCIVMVNLTDGSRCNVDDYVGWKESGYVLSSTFQYFGGLVLSELLQLQSGKYVPVDKWAIADIARRTYTVLDMSGFQGKNLPTWQGIDAMELAIVSQNRLLAVCLAHGSLPAATGETANKDAEACYSFLLDMNGNVLKTTELTPDAVSSSPAILGGVCVSASQDGKFLLYGSSAAPGVYLFDVDKGTETLIPASRGAKMTFAQWGTGGDIYYGLAGKAASGQITIYQTNMSQVSAGK